MNDFKNNKNRLPIPDFLLNKHTNCVTNLLFNDFCKNEFREDQIAVEVLNNIVADILQETATEILKSASLGISVEQLLTIMSQALNKQKEKQQNNQNFQKANLKRTDLKSALSATINVMGKNFLRQKKD